MTWLDDLEERLVRAGARGFGQQLADQIERALGRQEGSAPHGGGDVWDVATQEDERPAGEPPECAWCPVCRAIRLSQHAGPGLAGHMSGAADTLATAAQDALGLLDEILSSSAGRRGGPSAGSGERPPTGPPAGSDAGPPAGSDAGPPESDATPAEGHPGTAPGSGPQPRGNETGTEGQPAPGEPGHPGDGRASGT